MRRLLPCLLLLLVVLAACGDDDSGEPAAKATQPKTSEEPSPSAQREALKDTSTKPVIPKPSGSPPRKLVKQDLVKGKGPAAKPGDTLTVNYVGVAFSTGDEFDASWDRGQPFDVPLGAGRVIKGWDQGLVGMRKGGRRMLTIPPELGYGH
jgi:peptidylprolyl isomerase